MLDSLNKDLDSPTEERKQIFDESATKMFGPN
jgi:hypothetical protein